VQRDSHTADEEQQFIELMLRLLDAVDVDTRRKVAERLASYASTPRPIVRRLASDAPSVAQPILKARLPDDDTGSELDAFAQDDRVDNASELNEMFFTASADERRMILTNLDYGAGAPPRRMSEAQVTEASNRLEAAALQGRPHEFVRGLEQAMQISRAQAQRIVNDPSGEPLVVAAKVLALPVDVLQRILLCVNPAIGHSVRRIYSLTALYKDMSVESAWRLFRIWRQAEPGGRNAAYQPAGSGDAARPTRSSLATPRQNLVQDDARMSRLR
jgi:hypothetical protein